MSTEIEHPNPLRAKVAPCRKGDTCRRYQSLAGTPSADLPRNRRARSQNSGTRHNDVTCDARHTSAKRAGSSGIFTGIPKARCIEGLHRDEPEVRRSGATGHALRNTVYGRILWIQLCNGCGTQKVFQKQRCISAPAASRRWRGRNAVSWCWRQQPRTLAMETIAHSGRDSCTGRTQLAVS